MFQFQTGSIRSDVHAELPHAKVVRFQFQTGSIRRFHIVPHTILPFQCFNSKLVRLEEQQPTQINPQGFRFNSKLVRLEECSYLFRTSLTASFNSKLVRLEGSPKTTLILYYTLTVPVKLIFIFSRFK